MRKKKSGARKRIERRGWIEERLDALPGKNKGGLAAAMHTTASRVSEVIAGTRLVKSTEVPGMAEYLEMLDEEVLARLDGDESSIEHVGLLMVRGFVQAGIWQPAAELPRSEWRRAPISADPKYPNVNQFALEVRGTSMNREYPDGSTLICIQLIHWGRDPEDTDHVIVARRNEADEYEATVKELRLHPDGTWWLWPRSDDPLYQTPWQLTETDGDENMRIIAIVVGSYKPRYRRVTAGES